MGMGEVGDGADVGEADRLAAASVVGDREHDARHGVTVLRQEALKPAQVHVPLEGMLALRIQALGDDQVVGLRARCLDVAARGVEVTVGGDHPARPAQDGEEDRLGRTALVGRDDVREGHQILHRGLKAKERGAAGVALVSGKQRRLLGRAHGAGPAIGQQVNENVVGSEGEEVVVGGSDQRLAFFAAGHADRLDGLDPERLDNRLHHASRLRAPLCLPGRVAEFAVRKMVGWKLPPPPTGRRYITFDSGSDTTP